MQQKEINTRKFDIVEGAKSCYALPVYELTNNGLFEKEYPTIVQFVSGKTGEDGAKDGIITENLLSMLIYHLKELNVGNLRNRHTSIAIESLEDARMRIEERKRDRKNRGVLGTMNP